MANRPAVDCRHFVYRIYDKSEAPLYFGSCVDLKRRLAEHSRKQWWPSVRFVSVEEFPAGDPARLRERDAITQERPRHNGKQSPVYGKINVCVRIPPSLDLAMQKRAKKNGQTVDDAIAQALREWLASK